jgi:hypothetical protein
VQGRLRLRARRGHVAQRAQGLRRARPRRGSATGGAGSAAGPNGTTVYILHERGKSKANARVHADGRCSYNLEDSWMYNCERCAPDDPRLLTCADSAGRPGRGAPRSRSPPPATRPATQTPRNRPMGQPARFAPRRRWRRPWPPRCTTQQPPHCSARSFPPGAFFPGFALLE